MGLAECERGQILDEKQQLSRHRRQRGVPRGGNHLGRVRGSQRHGEGLSRRAVEDVVMLYGCYIFFFALKKKTKRFKKIGGWRRSHLK